MVYIGDIGTENVYKAVDAAYIEENSLLIDILGPLTPPPPRGYLPPSADIPIREAVLSLDRRRRQLDSGERYQDRFHSLSLTPSPSICPSRSEARPPPASRPGNHAPSSLDHDLFRDMIKSAYYDVQRQTAVTAHFTSNIYCYFGFIQLWTAVHRQHAVTVILSLSRPSNICKVRNYCILALVSSTDLEKTNSSNCLLVK